MEIEPLAGRRSASSRLPQYLMKAMLAQATAVAHRVCILYTLPFPGLPAPMCSAGPIGPYTAAYLRRSRYPNHPGLRNKMILSLRYFHREDQPESGRGQFRVWVAPFGEIHNTAGPRQPKKTPNSGGPMFGIADSSSKNLTFSVYRNICGISQADRQKIHPLAPRLCSFPSRPDNGPRICTPAAGTPPAPIRKA
jgi:hypothetical protein